MPAKSGSYDRDLRWLAAAEFNGRPLLTLLAMGAMVLFGLVPIVLAVRTARRAQRWVQTPIHVLESALQRSETTSETGTLVSVAGARYRYGVGRFTYTSSRIGVHPQAADNFGDWQQRWAETLAAHRRSDTVPLMAWVDPQDPENAVVDRSLRCEVLIFHAVFVALPLWPMSLAARALVARWFLGRP